MASTGADAEDRPRILFANEPRAYRDVLAAAVALLRPDAEVIQVEPDGLDEAIARYAPALVVCSRVSPAVEAGPHGWIVLYPDGQTFALVGRGAAWRRVPAVTLDGILEIVAEMVGPPPISPSGTG